MKLLLLENKEKNILVGKNFQKNKRKELQNNIWKLLINVQKLLLNQIENY